MRITNDPYLPLRILWQQQKQYKNLMYIYFKNSPESDWDYKVLICLLNKYVWN